MTYRSRERLNWSKVAAVRAVFVLAIGLAACGSREAPPDEGGEVGTGWRVQHVPECGFSVEMRGPATRHDLSKPDVPLLTETGYRADALSAVCIAAPASVAAATSRADIESILRGAFDHELRNAPEPVADQRFSLVDGEPVAVYRITFASGTAFVGKVVIAGNDLHELTAAVGKHRASEAEATYFLASYRAIPAP
jgi:hypothetical protein